MRRNVFIQLGLHQTFEYAFLAKTNFKEIASHVAHTKFYVPEILIERLKHPYTVIGIDMNPDKNLEIRQKFQGINNIHVWDYVILDRNKDEVWHGDYILKDELLPKSKKHNWKFKGEAITLKMLQEKIKALPNHEDCKILGIHANIEGSERYIFTPKTLQTLKPWVFRIAVNHYENVKENINKENPKIIREVFKNSPYEYVQDKRDSDEYLTFLRKDLV